MLANDPQDYFVYKPDDVPLAHWREIIKVCQTWEQHLLAGKATTVDEFAAQCSGIPRHLLTPELERVRAECLDVSSRVRQFEQTQYSQSERYLILDEIRSGGMGQVFRAFDRVCGRLVAVRKIRKEFAEEPSMRRRFLAEVELTAEMEHPGVISIYDQSIDASGREFYVMQLIHGEGTGTLQQAISSFHSRSDV